MKNVLFIAIATVLPFMSCAQKNDTRAIKEVIESFTKAGDTHDVATLDNLLDQHYQIHMNQLFGSSDLAVVPRAMYLEKIQSKEWGGDKRFVEVHDVLINGKSAVVHASLIGSKSTFKSFFVLVKNSNGQWLLLSDTPEIIG